MVFAPGSEEDDEWYARNGHGDEGPTEVTSAKKCETEDDLMIS